MSELGQGTSQTLLDVVGCASLCLFPAWRRLCVLSSTPALLGASASWLFVSPAGPLDHLKGFRGEPFASF